MGTIKIHDGAQEIACTVKRGKRVRTMALQVAMDGCVTVMVPRFLNTEIAQRFAERKVDWIKKQQALRARMREKYPLKELVNGETIAVFGRPYRLWISDGGRHDECVIRHNRLVINISQPTATKIKALLTRFLKSVTLQQANECAERYAPQLGVKVCSIYAATQAKRWGSCSRRGDIRINWKLAMAPLPVFNYVVAHEVCHLKCGNHSQKFWKTLKSLISNYEDSRLWLRENCGLITSL